MFNDDAEWYQQPSGEYKTKSKHVSASEVLEDHSEGFQRALTEYKSESKRISIPSMLPDDSEWYTQAMGKLTLDSFKFEDELIKPLGQILAEIVLNKDLKISEDSKNSSFSEMQIAGWREKEKDKSEALTLYEGLYRGNAGLLQLIQQYKSIYNYQKQVFKL